MQHSNLNFKCFSKALHDTKGTDSWTRLQKFKFVEVSEKPKFVLWQIGQFVEGQIICWSSNHCQFVEGKIICQTTNYLSKDIFLVPDSGYPHYGRDDKNPYPPDCRADKVSYPHNSLVIQRLWVQTPVGALDWKFLFTGLYLLLLHLVLVRVFSDVLMTFLYFDICH